MLSQRFQRLLKIIIILLLMPSTLFAYLDPGTGNILINLLIAGGAAAFFSLKGFFYSLSGKEGRNVSNHSDYTKIALFSEGKQYWTTFKPIINSLIKRQMEFQYFSIDIEDPALAIENKYIQSRFLGFGSIAYYKFSKIKADVLLSTTPNIGTQGYPLKRPDNVITMIHVFHSINDISAYEKGSLDHYDEIITVGEFQHKSIREIESIRNLPEKKLVPLGLPYLDVLISNKKSISRTNDKKIVLVGSSWGTKGCLKTYGTGFIRQIALAGYNVIVRPHPQSLKTEQDMLNKYKRELKGFNNIIWDETLSPVESMNAADILISDTSSIRFDFAFIYEKPVITLNIHADEMPGYEREFLNEIWTEKSSFQIGHVLERENISILPQTIQIVLNEYDATKISKVRNDTVKNFAQSSENISDYLIQKVREDK